MRHVQRNIEAVIDRYIDYYNEINGGIDGYYEKTILEANIYEIIDEVAIGCFSIHEERGLTSLYVYPMFKGRYKEIFDYVLKLQLFNNILFTSNDSMFLSEIENEKLDYAVQAYNFISDKTVISELKMQETKSDDNLCVLETFGDFVSYNNMNLDNTKSFLYKIDGDIVCFGALEPLRLNSKRFCISMIVNENYRRKGFGTKTVEFLISHLQSANLEVNARCYVLNDTSRKTLIKSGLTISNILYRIDDINNNK